MRKQNEKKRKKTREGINFGKFFEENSNNSLPMNTKLTCVH